MRFMMFGMRHRRSRNVFLQLMAAASLGAVRIQAAFLEAWATRKGNTLPVCRTTPEEMLKLAMQAEQKRATKVCG